MTAHVAESGCKVSESSEPRESIGQSSGASILTNTNNLTSQFGVNHMILAVAHVAEGGCNVSENSKPRESHGLTYPIEEDKLLPHSQLDSEYVTWSEKSAPITKQR